MKEPEIRIPSMIICLRVMPSMVAFLKRCDGARRRWGGGGTRYRGGGGTTGAVVVPGTERRWCRRRWYQVPNRRKMVPGT